MANLIHNLSENLEETLNSFKNTLSIILRNQHHLKLSQIKMFEQQEKHFDAIRWPISSHFRDENNKTSLNNEEAWKDIKKNPITGQDEWVEVPRNV